VTGADTTQRAPAQRASAPAKVNLSLSVLARRVDGYHELDGVMARLTLADEVAYRQHASASAGAGAGTAAPQGEHVIDTLERGASGGDPWLDAQPMSVDGSNLVLRAAQAYRTAAAAAGVRVPALRWQLTKRVPIAAGLGGGSSDAATVLRMLAERYPAGCDLATLAAGLGSDVPFFVQAAVAARARGRGERLEPVDVPPQPVVLVNPGVAVSAAEAYGWWSPGRSPVGATAPWWRGPAIVNDLEAGVAEQVPLVGALLERMRLVHDGPVAMSGSGATCFALARDAPAASALADRLRSHLPEGTWIAATSLAQRS